ncbi:MAG: hypothetical protein DCC58_13655 [Chloroflexi bacterium]|nr:MAG: hypothetical protein DCC58_13655 [Chloroflexota bacterium]
MDPVSVRLARTALLWLVLGAALGGLMLSDALVPGAWKLWFSPTHGHILFVGWFLQFAVGVGYWLLPRKRMPECPLGYREDVALAAYALLNAGLALRVIAEPIQRSGNPSDLLDWSLAASSLLQFAAIVIFTVQLWRRIIPRRASRSLDAS